MKPMLRHGGRGGAASSARIAALLVCCLTGCATQTNIADQAVKANRAVEDAHNQMLVLNVVRAYKQRPMYITAITKFGGPLGSVTPSASFSLPFGGAAISNFSFNPSFTTDTAIFDVAVLDNQGFMRGFLSPVDPRIVQYYLDQGWPAHFVLMLFIREIRNPDGTSLVNSPGERARFDTFSNRLKELIFDCGLHIEFAAPQIREPAIDAAHAKTNLGTLITLHKEGLALVPDGAGAYRLQNLRGQSVFAFADTTKPACAQFKVSTVRNRGEQSAAGEHVFVLRSTEGILYYLGELARAQLDGAAAGDRKPYRPETWVSKDSTQPLFVLEQAEGKRGGAIAVQHEGDWYSVPQRSDGGGRSMLALTLVSQLIGLHKDATELPNTGTVRLLGR